MILCTWIIYIGIDFRLLQMNYTFNSEINNLSVPFEVYNDTVGEVPEHFYLDFTYQYGQNHIQPPDATVTVFIIDSTKNKHNLTYRYQIKFTIILICCRSKIYYTTRKCEC